MKPSSSRGKAACASNDIWHMSLIIEYCIPCEVYSATGGKIINSDQERRWGNRGLYLLP
ncbi:MAG: hypothetical protein ABJB85_07460 [Nitrososphaerota archaeon]